MIVTLFIKSANRFLVASILMFFFSSLLQAQLPPAWGDINQDRVRNDNCARKYISPSSILWMSDKSGNCIKNANSFLEKGTGQVTFNRDGLCSMISKKDTLASILLDFGKELNGGVQIVVGMSPHKATTRFRIRFGESASEAMAELGKKNTTNDHAIRDFELLTPWFGNSEAGNN